MTMFGVFFPFDGAGPVILEGYPGPRPAETVVAGPLIIRITKVWTMSDSDKKNPSGFELDEIDFSQFEPPSKTEVVPEPAESDDLENVRMPTPEPETATRAGVKAAAPEAEFKSAPSPARGKKALIAVAAAAVLGLLLFLVLQLDGFGRLGAGGFGKEEQVVVLNKDILTSFNKLHKSLMKLKGLSKFTSNPVKINNTIQVIGLSEVLLTANTNATDRFLSYTENHGKTLERKGMGIFNVIGGYYRGKAYKRYKTAIKKYLSSFRTVLLYRQKHHTSIINGVQPYRDTHEIYYMRYRQNVKLHKIAYLTYLRFMDDRVKKNKKLVGLMPVGRLRDTFWFNSTLKEMQESWEF